MKKPSPYPPRKPQSSVSIFAGVLTALIAIPAFAATNWAVPGPPTPSAPLTLSVNDTLTVSSSNTFTYSGSSPTVNCTGTSGTNHIWNSGTISNTGGDRVIRSNPASGSHTLIVTNYSTGILLTTNNDVIKTSVAACPFQLDNYGLIQSVTSVVGSAMQALDLNSTTASNILYNYNTGQILAAGADAIRPGVGGAITNSGLISALVLDDGLGSHNATGSDGIDVQNNTNVTITNTGALDAGSSPTGIIQGRHGITGGDLTHAINITIYNNVGSGVNGLLKGVNGSGINIDNSGSTATIINYGTIEGNWGYYDAPPTNHFPAGDGDGIDVDGTVYIYNDGNIYGNGSSNHAEAISVGGGIIENDSNGVITGADNGILVDDSSGGNAFAQTTITNYGLISGTAMGAYAIRLVGTYNDIVTNDGFIVGNVDLGYGDDVLSIFGENTSGTPTADIQGDVNGGSGTNTLNVEVAAGETYDWGAYQILNFATLNKSGDGVLDLTHITSVLPVGLTINVLAGTLVVSYSQLTTLLSPVSGAQGLLDISSTDYTVVSLSSLTGTVIVKGGSGHMAQIGSYLSLGENFSSGYWDGPAGTIRSTRAATNPIQHTTLGSVDNNLAGYGPFDGVTVTSSDAMIKYTFYGDADLNGVVTKPGNDNNLFVYGITTVPLSGLWYYGDFDYSGGTNADDFNVLVYGNAEQSTAP